MSMEGTIRAKPNDQVANRVTCLPTSEIRRIHARAEKIGGVVDLTLGDTYFSTPIHIIDAAKKALDSGYTHYTLNQGLPLLREAIAEQASQEYGTTIAPDQVLVTSGVTQAILYSILSVINPGDEVLIISPSYNSYPIQVKFAEGIVKYVQSFPEEQYHLSYDQIEKLVTARSKMVVINNPTNPTGNVFEKRDVGVISEIARNHNLFILADELYDKLVYDGSRHYSLASVSGNEDRLLLINGPTKTYAMTGWRVGYVIAPSELVPFMVRLQQIDGICAPAMAQLATHAAITGPQDCVEEMKRAYTIRRDLVSQELKSCETVGLTPSRGTFFSFPSIMDNEKDATGFVEWSLAKEKVATVPGKIFGPPGANCIRISFACEMDSLIEGMRRLRAALDSYKHSGQ